MLCDGWLVELTPREFRLLCLLASNPEVVFDRDEPRARVLPDEVFVARRGVGTLAERLRRVEKNPGQPSRIVTARGVGYKFGEGVTSGS